jgi:hypothetical protein
MLHPCAYIAQLEVGIPGQMVAVDARLSSPNPSCATVGELICGSSASRASHLPPDNSLDLRAALS